MPSVVYVDMSAKVEQWSKNSAVAASNGFSHVCLVPSRVKQKAKGILKERYGDRSIQYRLFAILVYLAIQPNLKHTRQIVIDKDYQGAQVEATIKNLLLDLLYRDDPTITAGFIRFEQAKNSNADRLAKMVFDEKRIPDHVLTFAEIERVIRRG